VNEEGLALTEADPVADERNVYTSGRGKVRAISRVDGDEVWEQKIWGRLPEMILTRDVLYARTGGQFARLEDGDTVERGTVRDQRHQPGKRQKSCGATKGPIRESRTS